MVTDHSFASLVEWNQSLTHGTWIWNRQQTSQSQDPFGDSWEVRTFAEDTRSLMGGATWPPRSYKCTFCRRVFQSAQALGGHMNVHRRERARLSQMSQAGVLHHPSPVSVFYQFPRPKDIFGPNSTMPCLDTPSTLIPISPPSSSNPNLQFTQNVYPNQAEATTSKQCKLNSEPIPAHTKESSTVTDLDLELRL
ncbi:hypothetical protein MLD38_015519 [Melastoma candidum]|uniref:Uncharacterized protein n=1 Tax=Melastoma candidum TaxID=119954 RepID=A0ACB9RGH5_9MYRT|nr:hypothetical protein MLD38_015519 [Melastoma candidum]